MKIEIKRVTDWQRVVDAACVPQCIYRGFCPEPKSCGKTQTNVFPIYRENYEHLFLIGERIKLDYEISKI